MDAKTFEAIKGKIETLKQKKAKAEGAIESIVENWKTTYGFSTVEEAETKLAELTTKQQAIETEMEGYYSELEDLTNWGLI